MQKKIVFMRKRMFLQKGERIENISFVEQRLIFVEIKYI